MRIKRNTKYGIRNTKKGDKMAIETIRWKNNHVELIDQRLLPGKLKYVSCRNAEEMWRAIKTMQVRGAPAIGIAGAYGVYLGIRKSRAGNTTALGKETEDVIEYLSGSRPTAVNLFWALERMRDVLMNNMDKSPARLKKILLSEAERIREEDRDVCRRIGYHGRTLIKKNMKILTHCNAGALATADYGTALGVIFSSKSKINKVYVDETRPVLQGARLTAWELVKEGIDAVLICDNMAASLMAKKEIDAVIVGADRIAGNGDTANKIGTYSVAVLARHHKVPFYVAAPSSTFDTDLKSGAEIPIEEREHDEVRKIGGQYMTVKNIRVKNPAFDVTPADLITGIITEHGVIKNPNKKKIKKLLG